MDTSQLIELIKLKLKQFNSISHFFIAYSGGLDSHVLLHLCVANEQLKSKVTAVYINHSLQKEAQGWGRHCEAVCRNLDINFISLKVDAQAKSGESPEEAARNARYAAFKSLLNHNDVLLTAHHAEDQLETVLLHLFRGGGLKGVSGIPASLPFGKGQIIRPLLDVAKAEIIDYANKHKLLWVEDPSNQDSRFDRNFLRNELIPLIKTRWPSVTSTVARSARHCSDSQQLLSKFAEDWLESVSEESGDALSLSKLKAYPDLQQDLIIRSWFEQLGLKMPSTKLLRQITDSVLQAKADADPMFRIQGRILRRYRDTLYLLATELEALPEEISWPAGQNSLHISGHVYQAIAGASGIPQQIWQAAEKIIRFRTGGEVIALPGRQGRHELKKLFQERGIPPWERSRIPLFYLNNRLAAVGKFWISAEFYSNSGGNNIRIVRQISLKDHDGRANVD